VTNATAVDEVKKGVIESGILVEWVTPAQDSTYNKTNQATHGQSTNKAETSDSSSNINILPPAFQSRVMFNRRGGNHAKCRNMSIRPTEGKENQHIHPVGGNDRVAHVCRQGGLNIAKEEHWNEQCAEE